MNNALLYFGGLLVVAFAALFAVPHFIDWNGYRGVFEEEASKVLGRDVRVGGAVNVRFLPTPYVRFEKVRLADPTGQTGEPFVSADSFTMKLSGPALLRGVLEANEIELDRPELTLALDNAGGGNWTSVQIKAGALPFIPQNVALHSVKIVSGAIAFYNSEAQQIARAEAINGEFSADALKGPFKFKGEALWAGEVRDVKFATTLPDASGAFLVKATMRGVASDTAYALDANVTDLSGKPKITGNLTGKIPLQAKAAAEITKPADPVVMDLTSRVEANTGGAKISDITLSVENVAEPQLISGTASAVWGAAPKLDVVLASKWLDLDRLAGAGQDSATFPKVKQLGLSVLRGLAGNGEASARIEIDQVKLGGETAGAMKIDAARSGAAVRLKELKAGFPGGSRLDLSGDLKEGDGKVSFAGEGYIHGTNLARLLEWASKSGANLDIKSDGPFSAEGQVLIADDRLEFKEASADIGGKSFTGDVVVSGDTRRRVAVTLEAASIDSSELFPETSRVLESSLRRALGIAAAGDKKEAPVTSNAAASEGDMSVRVLTGELKHQDKTFRDVDATVRLDGGTIHVPSAKFTTPSGLVVGIDARISESETQPKGTLAYDVVANSSAAIKDIAALTGLASTLPEANVARLTSAKLAGLIRLGNRGPGSADVTVDGTLQNARVGGSAEFDGGLQGWRSAASRVRLTARAPALASLMSALGVNEPVPSVPSAHEAELVFASTGKMMEGAAATVSISAPGLTSQYDGTFALPVDAPVHVAGTARVAAENARDALIAAGMPSSGAVASHKLSGVIAATRDAGKWTLASRNLALGGAKLQGTATIAVSSEGQTTLNGDLSADALTVAGLLAPISDVPAAIAPDPTAPPDQASAHPIAASGIWPSGTFSLPLFDNLAGDIRIKYNALQLSRGVVARDGSVGIAFAPGKISIANMSGRAAGGTLSGAVHLAKTPSGVALDSNLKIEGADLAQLSAAARGKATIDAKATAQAQSAAGLLAVLNGSGTIALDQAVVPAAGPSTGAGVIAQVLANKVRNQPEDVTAALQASLAAARAELGTRTIPFVIADGVAKLDTTSLESTDGRVTTATVVDLSTLALDSAWKLAAIMPPLPPPPDPLPGWVAPAPKGPLPPASIVYTGNLGALPEVTASLDASDMQRELTVRLLERNVEELERLRRIDEHRAKMEKERRLQIEAERAAAAAAAKAAAQRPPAAAPAMPPILPESSGQNSDGQSSTTPGDQSSVPPATAPAPAAADAPPVASPPPAATADGTTAPPVTAPPVEGAVTADGTPPIDGAAVVPGAETAVPEPQPAARPRPRPTQTRRTSSDEVMRSLGGYP